MDGLMNAVDIMEFMRISRTTLWRLLQYDDFPKPVMVMGMKRWRRDELESWLRARQVAAAGLSPAG